MQGFSLKLKSILQIEGLRKEMLAGLADQADDDSSSVLSANRVMSEDTTHYLLLKTNPQASNSSGFLTKQTEKAPPTQSTQSQSEVLSQPSTSKQTPILGKDVRKRDLYHVSEDLVEGLSDDDEETIMESVEAQRMLLESMSSKSITSHSNRPIGGQKAEIENTMVSDTESDDDDLEVSNIKFSQSATPDIVSCHQKRTENEPADVNSPESGQSKQSSIVESSVTSPLNRPATYDHTTNAQDDSSDKDSDYCVPSKGPKIHIKDTIGNNPDKIDQHHVQISMNKGESQEIDMKTILSNNTSSHSSDDPLITDENAGTLPYIAYVVVV